MIDEPTQAVIRFWCDKLIQWPEDVVVRMGLSAVDSEYLSTVGLPSGVDWNLVVSPPMAGSPAANLFVDLAHAIDSISYAYADEEATRIRNLAVEIADLVRDCVPRP